VGNACDLDERLRGGGGCSAAKPVGPIGLLVLLAGALIGRRRRRLHP